MKVYIERNNIQAELIRFRKQLSTLFTFTKRDGSRTNKLSIRQMAAPFATLTVNIPHQRYRNIPWYV